MSKLRILFIVSLVIFGVLLGRVFLWPVSGAVERYSEVQRESLLRTEDGWIVQFDILNQEGADRRYNIEVVADGRLYKESCLIPSEGLFTYIHQIRSDQLTSGQVTFGISKEGEVTPFEQMTYYLK